VLGEVPVVVAEPLLDQQLLQLPRTDPREELQLEPLPLVDVVLEYQLHLLHLPLRLRLAVPQL
jgi:hypothetical protein